MKTLLIVFQLCLMVMTVHTDTVVALAEAKARFQLPDGVRIVDEVKFEGGERKHFEAGFGDLEANFKGVIEIQKNEFATLQDFKMQVYRSASGMFTGESFHQATRGNTFVYMWKSSSGPGFSFGIRYAGIHENVRFQFVFIGYGKKAGAEELFVGFVNRMVSTLTVGNETFKEPLLTFDQGDIVFSEAFDQGEKKSKSLPESSSPELPTSERVLPVDPPQFVEASASNWFLITGCLAIALVIAAFGFYLWKK